MMAILYFKYITTLFKLSETYLKTLICITALHTRISKIDLIESV